MKSSLEIAFTKLVNKDSFSQLFHHVMSLCHVNRIHFSATLGQCPLNSAYACPLSEFHKLLNVTLLLKILQLRSYYSWSFYQPLCYCFSAMSYCMLEFYQGNKASYVCGIFFLLHNTLHLYCAVLYCTAANRTAPHHTVKLHCTVLYKHTWVFY